MVHAVRAGGNTTVRAEIGTTSEALEVTIIDQIVFVCGQNICVINEDGTGERRLLETSEYINPTAG